MRGRGSEKSVAGLENIVHPPAKTTRPLTLVDNCRKFNHRVVSFSHKADQVGVYENLRQNTIGVCCF